MGNCCRQKKRILEPVLLYDPDYDQPVLTPRVQFKGQDNVETVSRIIENEDPGIVVINCNAKNIEEQDYSLSFESGYVQTSSVPIFNLENIRCDNEPDVMTITPKWQISNTINRQ